MSLWENNEEIQIFREYLRIPSVHPDIDYEPCVVFLKKQADYLGLPIKVYHPVTTKKPVVVITWIGTQPELPTIILNSHMDVVPVFPEKWTHPPFSADIDEEGRIFARGSQDMKCVGMQYLAAIRALKRNGVQALKRTIHVTFVPDEEIGGHDGGMEDFVTSNEFKNLNIGFSLDEGIAGPNETYPIFYAERSIWQPCITFLTNQARSLDLDYKIYYANNEVKKPVLILTWTGSRPELSSILLNSHMDVVPVFPENWTHPPFAAEMDAEGRIFGRGAQDMKCVGMQYLAAIRALKKSGIKSLSRTIHISFVPDEEINGLFGMSAFVKSPDFQMLNIGFALDEGMATPGDEFSAFYAERSIWQINFKISGTAGHGSLLLKNTAAEKLNFILNKLMTFRAEQLQCLELDPKKHIGDVSTINLTRINGGVQSNVVPPLLEACFDMRLAISLDLADFEEKINCWCAEAGGGIEIEWLTKFITSSPTKLDQSNKFWTAFQIAVKQLNIHVNTLVFPGGTDIQYVRDVGIPAIGFSPMNNTPVLLHDHDEFLRADTYLRGIEIYANLIQKLANVQ